MEGVTNNCSSGLKTSEKQLLKNEENDYESFLPTHKVLTDNINIRGVSEENRKRMSRMRMHKEKFNAKRLQNRRNKELINRRKRAFLIKQRVKVKAETPGNKISEEVIKNTPLSGSSCRLCGTIEDNLVNVLGQTTGVLELVAKYLHIEIKQDDKLPHYICESCKYLVKNWDKYYHQCTLLQSKLQTEVDSKNKRQEKPTIVVSTIKSEQTIPEEDDVEKLLRRMHAESPTHQATQDDDFEMDVEYLDEERDLVDEALLHQGKSIDNLEAPENSNLLDELSEKKQGLKEERLSRKVVRVSQKLSETELRGMLERTGFSELTTVKVLKFNRNSKMPLNIDKYLENFNDILTKSKIAENSDGDTQYYDILAKSYAHHMLEYIHSDSEMYFRCPDCSFYYPSIELAQHMLTEHLRRVALCDFCRLLLPYDTDGNKNLVTEHIQLHETNHLENDPKIILNVFKMLEYEEENEQKNVETAVKIKKEVKEKSISRFRCTQCNGRFQTAQLVREHVKLHRYEKLECSECKKSLFSQFQLQKHQNSEHGVKIISEWFCQFCNLKLADKNSFDHHMKQVTHPDEFFCPHCSSSCPSIENLEIHCQSHPEPTYVCDTCGAAFLNKESLKVHTDNMHSSVSATYTCPHCQYKNFSQIGLRNHIRMHHSESKFICQDSNCSQVFQSENALRDHTKQKHEQVQCENCPQTFASPNRLKEHNKQKHQQIQNYQCPLCDWIYNHAVNLKKHFEVHIEKGHTICKVCNQEFEVTGEKLEIEDVIKHKERHSAEENLVYQRPYSPSVGRMTPWKDNSGARMFCRECGIACSVPVELKKHQKTHKPFYCATCHTVSQNEQTFLLHMEQHADRKHACKTCGKPFLTLTALNIHSRIHSDSPKYECSVCSRKFLIIVDWKRHERVCRESHAWPRMNNKTIENRSLKRKRKYQIEENQPVADSVKYIEPNITYELVNEESESEFLKEEDYIEYIVQEENSGDGIEIDESQLTEFQQWQKSSDGIKSEIITYTDGAENQNLNPMYYSIEEVPGNKKQLRFIPQYVIQESKDDSESSEEQKFINLSQGESSQTNAKFIIPSDGDAEGEDEGAEEESGIVYTISSEEGNMVYNIRDNLSLAQAANIIFEEGNQDQGEDNSNLSYVFDNSDNSNITIFFKDKEETQPSGE